MSSIFDPMKPYEPFEPQETWDTWQYTPPPAPIVPPQPMVPPPPVLPQMPSYGGPHSTPQAWDPGFKPMVPF